MAKRKQQKTRDVRRNLRGKIAAAVAEAFPNCTAEFCGGVERSRMATRGPTLGFRVKDSRGKYRSNIIWIDPTYEGEVNAAWVAHSVKQSNG
jgi:hypothetical protein